MVLQVQMSSKVRKLEHMFTTVMTWDGENSCLPNESSPQIFSFPVSLFFFERRQVAISAAANRDGELLTDE